MNIIPKITFKTLKKNKTRTIVTIIGVILSVTMICSVMTFAETVRQNLIKDHIYENGDYFFSSKNISAEKLHKLEADERLEALSAVHEIGFAEIKNGAGKQPYYKVKGANQSYFENMPIHLKEGRYPQNSNEIIVSEYIIYEAMIDLHIGDKLSLDIGKRPYSNTIDFSDTEKIKPDMHKEYTVVGIFKENEFLESIAYPGYCVFTMPDSSANYFNIYCKTNNVKEIRAFIDDYNLKTESEEDINSKLYSMGLSNKDIYGHYNIGIYNFTTIPVLIIVLCSIALIYNAFSISVSERSKQFGLLASVGATKKQIRFAVLFEAFFISIIGIPIGILAGIGCVAIFMEVSFSWQSILAAFFISAITVFISAWIPSRRAAKYTAVESIRGTKEIKIEKKPIKVSRLTYKLFGFEGTLGAKYFKRNRRKYRAAIISMFMSIIMFISANSFINFLDSDEAVPAIVKIVSYGFIILISLIAAANVFNTISTNVSLYRREFAMMKSVGMTPRGFRRMLNFECIICGLRALLFGLLVSLALNYLVYICINSEPLSYLFNNETYAKIAFYIPWGAIAVAVFSVFAVVFASMMYAMHKTKEENIIDTLKNENF